ncbi:MAG: hypothetical protein AAB887_00300 [Patescibacteria group bacterium]
MRNNGKVKPNTACKIGIIGAKEVGKTGLANLLNGYLKIIGAHCDLVPETARNSPFLLNEGSGIGTLYWVLGTQIAAESLVQERRQFAICDRTVIDLIPFTICGLSRRHGVTKDKIRQDDKVTTVKKIIKSYLNARPYDLLFYVPINQKLWKLFSSPDDAPLQFEIDKELKIYLEELDLKYVELKKINSSDRLSEIMDSLRKLYTFSLESKLGWLGKVMRITQQAERLKV